MGASREAFFSAIAEPALFLSWAALARLPGDLSVSGLFESVTPAVWAAHGPALALVVTALGIVLLAESCRVPVDDPNTHLELTMIHEVMILDHGGPDLAFLELAAALKLWIFGALFAGLAMPVRSGNPWVDGGAFLGAMALTAVGVGVVESVMARLRLRNVPVLLAGATALAALSLILMTR
jgi:formate hydrogenlyase subunit 4